MDDGNLKCPECGHEIESDSTFCPGCGKVLALDAARKDPADRDQSLYPCPVCGKKNKKKDTFKCPSCDTEHLCHSHEIKKSRRDPDTGDFITEFFCSNCWKQEGFATFSE